MAPSEKERREYFRVDDTLPLDYEFVPAEELDKTKASLCSDPVIPSVGEDIPINDIDPNLLRLLEVIDSKLNYIIRYITNREFFENMPPIHEVNFSAGGVRFRSEKGFKKGDVLKIAFGLPPYPYRVIRVLGEVVRVEKKVEGKKTYYYTAVKFIEVDDEVRNDMINYCLEVERKKIKKRLEEYERINK